MNDCGHQITLLTRDGECKSCYRIRLWREAHPNSKRKGKIAAKNAICHPNRKAIHSNGLCNSCYKRYNVYDVDIVAMLIMQSNKCAACGDVFVSDKDAFVDHDHVTGNVRGLLC